MPEPVREIMRAAYGDATAQIFMVSAIIGVVALVAILFIKEEPLRRTVDIVTPSAKGEDKHDDGGPARPRLAPAAGPAFRPSGRDGNRRPRPGICRGAQPAAGKPAQGPVGGGAARRRNCRNDRRGDNIPERLSVDVH